MAMRMLLGHRHRFNNSTIKEIITERKAWMEKLERVQFIKYQKIFAKIHYRHLQQIQHQKNRQDQLKFLCLMSELPSRSIIDYFQGEGRQFSQDFTTKAFTYLSKAAIASEFDYNATLDHYGYRLFNSPEFKNLAEQLKFGLKQNKFTISNMLQIGRACIGLKYADYELFTLLLDQFHRYISNNPEYRSLNEHNTRYYQIQKYGYYDIKYLINKEALMANASFKEMLEIVRDRHLYEQSKFIGVKENISAEEKKNVENLLQTIKNAEQGFAKLVNAIISLRDGYRRMVKISGNPFISQQSVFVLELLELEESLLMTKILNIDDIRNPALLDNKIKEVARVEEILTRLLNIENLDEFQVIVKKDQQKIIKKDPQEEYRTHVEIVSQMIEIVSGFAVLDKHLYCNNQSRSLVSLKWEKTLINNEFIREDLNVAKYFRRLFKDSYEFIRTYEQDLAKLYQKAPISYSLSYFSSLLKMGFFKETFSLLERNPLSDLKVNQLTFEKLEHLMSVLNNLGIYFQKQPFKEHLLSKLLKLSKEEETQDFHLNLRFCLDVLNYLIQNSDLSVQKNKQLYAKYLQKVQKYAKYYTNYERKDELVQEAFRVLATQKPQIYANSSQYLQYLKRETSNQNNSNPHLEIVRQTIYKNYLGITPKLVEMQQYVQIGSRRGRPHGLVIVGSEGSSLDGEYITGDYRSYLSRLQRNNGVFISYLTVNSLFSFDYDENNIKFTFLSPIQITKRFNQILHPDIEAFTQFEQNIKQIHANLLSEFPKQGQIPNASENLPKVLQKIGLQLELMIQLLHVNNEAKTEAEHVSREIDLFIHLKELEKDFNQFNAIQYESDASILKGYVSDALKLITSMRQILLKRIQTFKSPNLSNRLSINLNGRRQTIQTYGNYKGLGSIGSELVDSIYYLDKTYLEYEDWAEWVGRSYQINSIKYEEMSAQNKILIRKYCKHVNHVISLAPFQMKSDKIQLLKLNLERAYPKADNNEGQQLADEQTQAQFANRLKMIINLQNFKHELKLTKTKDEIVDYILGFKFIDELKEQEILKQVSEDLLPRNGEAYFTFLQNKAQKQSLQSPYITYILQKLQKTEDIKELLKQREALRISNRALFREGKLSREQYYEAIGKMQDKIITALEGLKSKMLDDMDDTLLSGGLKMVDIEVKDINDVMRWFRRAPHYERLLDDDYVYADGDLEAALQRKRTRAQHNLKKMALIHKIANAENKKHTKEEFHPQTNTQSALQDVNNEKQLNAESKKQQSVEEVKKQVEGQAEEYLTLEDREYLSKWKESTWKTQSIESGKYTKLKIKDLCQEDQKRLELFSCSLAENQQMLLIDLIFEFNNFLDEKVLKKVEKIFLGDILKKQYKFSSELFQSSLNKEFSELSYQKQKVILDQASQLRKQELDSLEEMVKVFKVEGYFDRNRYAQLFKGLRVNLDLMNAIPLRGQFIPEYIRKLEEEFFAHYNPLLVQELKTQQINKLWKDIFGNSDQNIHEFRKIVRQLCSRVEVIGKNGFPFFGDIVLRILEHPLTGQLLKQTLVALLQLYKVDLKIDSKTIVGLLKGQHKLDQNDINKRLLSVANKNFIEVINAKIHQI